MQFVRKHTRSFFIVELIPKILHIKLRISLELTRHDAKYFNSCIEKRGRVTEDCGVGMGVEVNMQGQQQQK